MEFSAKCVPGPGSAFLSAFTIVSFQAAGDMHGSTQISAPGARCVCGGGGGGETGAGGQDGTRHGSCLALLSQSRPRNTEPVLSPRVSISEKASTGLAPAQSALEGKVPLMNTC